MTLQRHTLLAENTPILRENFKGKWNCKTYVLTP